MTLMIDVLPAWVSFADANHSQHRLKKHLFVFLAVLVGVGTSGVVHAVEMQRTTTSGRVLEQLKTNAVVGNRIKEETPSSLSSMDSSLVESLFRLGLYSATFDRICHKETSRHLLTGSSGSPAAEVLTSEDRPHSPEVDSSDLPTEGAAAVRVRRSSRREKQTKWREILPSNECTKVNALRAKANDARSEAAATRNMDELDKECSEDEEHSLGCYPIPQVVHLTDLCSRLHPDVDATDMRTIVYACPDITCCVIGHRCQVKHYLKVNKSFMVEEKTITLSFRNHTECTCAQPGLKSTVTPRRSQSISSPAGYQGSGSTSTKGTP